MSVLSDEFIKLKVSALNKAKLISKDVKEVTIGPNCKSYERRVNTVEKTKKDVAVNNKRLEQKNKDAFKSIQERVALGKVIIEAEIQRRDEVENNIRSRIANINAVSQKFELNSKSEWLRRQKILIEQNRQQENRMLQVLQEYDRQACNFTEQLQLQYQKEQDERNKRIQEIQNQVRERQQYKPLLDAIFLHQQTLRVVYQEIVGILKTCIDANSIIMKHSIIKTYPDVMDKIKNKCKEQKATKVDLQTAIKLVQEITNLKDIIAKEVEETNNKYKAEKKIQEERYEKELEKQKVQAKLEQLVEQTKEKAIPLVKAPSQTNEKMSTTSIVESSTVSSDYKFVSKENLHMYAELQNYLDSYQNSFEAVLTDTKLKQFKFACQKAVNIPLNAISSVSSQHMYDKYQKLYNLLSGKSVEAGGTVISAGRHPQGIPYCMNLLAKKFVLQGDLIVSSNPEAAFPFAAVLTALWIDFPDFGKLVLAHFYKEAPYLLPMYPIMTQDQTTEDYYKSLGYHFVDGVVEKQDKFLKRMSGIMRLYTAVMISRLRKAHQDRSHPYGLRNAWKWFADTFNLQPSADITATMIFQFLEVAGSNLQLAYGKQFKKLLVYLHDVYVPLMQKLDSGGPMARLEVLLQKIKRTGQIDAPRGRLAEGFW